MALLEQYLGTLEQLKVETALAGLSGVSDDAGTAFGYGKAVGRLEGIELARRAFETLLNEVEQKGTGVHGRQNRSRS